MGIGIGAAISIWRAYVPAEDGPFSRVDRSPDLPLRNDAGEWWCVCAGL